MVPIPEAAGAALIEHKGDKQKHTMDRCRRADCQHEAYDKGFCRAHYERMLRILEYIDAVGFTDMLVQWLDSEDLEYLTAEMFKSLPSDTRARLLKQKRNRAPTKRRLMSQRDWRRGQHK